MAHTCKFMKYPKVVGLCPGFNKVNAKICSGVSLWHVVRPDLWTGRSHVLTNVKDGRFAVVLVRFRVYMILDRREEGQEILLELQSYEFLTSGVAESIWSTGIFCNSELAGPKTRSYVPSSQVSLTVCVMKSIQRRSGTVSPEIWRRCWEDMIIRFSSS
jgi:hypothetical protein